MDLPVITHEYGEWSGPRFVAAPAASTPAGVAFYVTTHRMCRGAHDWRCTHIESQTWGPLVLPGVKEDDVVHCPNCNRPQPPVQTEATGETPVCVHCTDISTPRPLPGSSVSLRASATLRGAAGALAAADVPGRTVPAALMDDTAGVLAQLLATTAEAIRQDPRRASYSENATLVFLARQILANASRIEPPTREPFPAATDEGE